jgi:hypothetical protein
VLAVYTGTVLAALTPVAGNDDAPGTATSAVTFAATGGTTYQIAVDGFAGAEGDVLLTGSLDSNVLYATDFEQFALGTDTLAGMDGWLGIGHGGGATGVIDFSGGRAGYIGYNPPSGAISRVFAYRPVDFQPVQQGRPVVGFSTDLLVVDSTNYRYDQFTVGVYNRAGALLAAVVLDNSTLRVWRDDAFGPLVDTGMRFQNGERYTLGFAINFADNIWSASLNGALLFNRAPFNANGSALDLGGIDLEWRIATAGAPGNNFLVFDNCFLTAIPTATAPTITKEPLPLSVAVGGLAVFEAEAAGSGPLTFQWRFNGTDLVGQTNVSLSLVQVTTNDAGLYRLVASNFVGSALSQEVRLTVTPPAPSSVFGAPTVTSRGLQFNVTGTPGRTYRLETSPDLVNWSEAAAVLNQNGTVLLIDTTATNSLRKFYRMREGN